MMVIKKKTLLLTGLVFLLVVVGYANHRLNKQALLEASNEYEKYEEDQMAKMNEKDTDDSIATNSEGMNQALASSLSIVDSKTDIIDQLTQLTNSNIEKKMENEESVETTNYFVEYRLSRDQLRSELIERLNGIINNEQTTNEVRSLAQKEILRMGNISEDELYLEGLIKGKGFEDAIVFLKEDSARIIVDTQQLTEQDQMKIFEIVKNETNVEPVNIKIMKKY
ncbi:SpoIIIAH-like family protein [Sporosalibacterium faouarense]|uniref:SpoIIIAH-like family protein n=1 Tax=Sporosalibacterium faouarense TaxID=516123 RepID=UPI00141D24CE|nr:SpoIIIAH-like family protein [Sporosalibacterium faouarense]MTI48197.1 SpoIIIAH-like family protein [Bacillota bacterium]